MEWLSRTIASGTSALGHILVGDELWNQEDDSLISDGRISDVEVEVRESSNESKRQTFFLLSAFVLVRYPC